MSIVVSVFARSIPCVAVIALRCAPVIRGGIKAFVVLCKSRIAKAFIVPHSTRLVPLATQIFGVVNTGETVVGITVPVPLNVYSIVTPLQSNPAIVFIVPVCPETVQPRLVRSGCEVIEV